MKQKRIEEKRENSVPVMAGGKKKENKKDWPEKNGGTMANYANDFAATGVTGKEGRWRERMAF